MTTTPATSPDINAVTDLVMNRQLITVDRDHARGIVAMVLECAAEAAGPAVPAYQPAHRRINATVQDVSTIQIGPGYCDHIIYETGWDGGAEQRGSTYTAPRGTAVDPSRQARELKELVGHDVALWITDDPFYAMPTLLQYNDLGTA